MHQKEHVVGKVMLLLNVCIKPMRNFIKVIFPYATYEAIRLHVLFNTFQLITKFAESVNNQTLDDSQKNNNNEEEECNVENNTINFVVITNRITCKKIKRTLDVMKVFLRDVFQRFFFVRKFFEKPLLKT